MFQKGGTNVMAEEIWDLVYSHNTFEILRKIRKAPSIGSACEILELALAAASGISYEEFLKNALDDAMTTELIKESLEEYC